MSEQPAVEGLNGVLIRRRDVTTGAGFRSYEVHQRERVGQSTALVKPGQFISSEFARDPYPLLGILREHYPCYLNWVTNDFWITRYDDVTSVFVDDANFETRPRSWYFHVDGFGRDLGEALPVLQSQAAYLDAHARTTAERILAELSPSGGGDLAIDFAARLPLELLVGWLGLPDEYVEPFVGHYLNLQQNAVWEPKLREAGVRSMHALVELLRPLLAARRATPGDDLLSVLAQLPAPHGLVQAEDVVITLLERDFETLHGGLANLCYLLLTHPDALAQVRADRLLVKYAYLETMRHSAPVPFAQRFALHEVERFGRLLPEGALLICAAAAGNRDPRVFANPDHFNVTRMDICQREPRGQYRADGLACGISFGVGKPSRAPVLPEDRPRSLYALTRDVAVWATHALLDAAPNLRLEGAPEAPRSLQLHGMHCCRKLTVRF